MSAGPRTFKPDACLHTLGLTLLRGTIIWWFTGAQMSCFYWLVPGWSRPDFACICNVVFCRWMSQLHVMVASIWSKGWHYYECTASQQSH